MTVLAAYAASLVPALGWTLAHFLWQGALVAVTLRFLLKTCATARARHDLALAALVLMALLPVATFAWLKGDVQIVLVPAGFPGLDAGQGQGWETVAVAAWLAGVAVLAVRTAGGLLLIERLRRGATPLPQAWAARCAALHRRMTGSLNVAFAQSEAIAAPLVAGWLKPMVLIPAAALVRLPADQLEALILHELAHVRRLDAIANLIQSIVETALFYHPAVWWVSQQVRIEREHCCDDLAVAAVEDPALYVSALQAIEAMRAAPYGVLAANGGDLKSRAARILGLVSAPERPALSRTAAILILTAAGMALTHGAAVQAKPGEAPWVKA
ncbi:MAG TPA: M56 family metallopeptidase, partial [Phenylobacterium sp.]|nr:M56 family metallopeptidase [Phenylobacterium sp.]